MKLFKPQAAFSVLAGALALAGCSARSEARQDGSRLIVFLDQTASIDAPQRAAWVKEATGLTRRLTGGSSVTIYAIHDRTMDAAPLFEADIPEMKDDATLDESHAAHLALVRARDGARAAIAKGLEAGAAPQTDIFSTIDRVEPDLLRRPTVIVYFSDMLNSTPDLNMEVPGAIRRPDISRKLQDLARRHYWQPSQLAGDQVYCVLNSIESGGRGPAVDRLIQRAFYDALFQAVGAHLLSYETRLAGPILSSAVPGGSYVVSR